MGRIFAGLGGGLGNRLSPLCSALRLADLYKRELYVHWSEQVESLVGLADLFGSELPFHPITPQSGPVETFPRRDAGGHLIEPARVHLVDDDVDILITGFEFVGHHLDQRSYDYEARDPFMRELGGYFRRIPLAPEIERRLAELDSRIDYAAALGVHIRRGYQNSIYTEMERTRDWWPLDAYVQAIEEVLEANPALTQIYLASNSPEAKDYLTGKFPRLIVMNEQAGDGWSTLPYQREAFVDLLALSRCATILRQPWTTYSMFAAVLNYAPMVTMTGFDMATMAPTLSWDVPDDYPRQHPASPPPG